MSFQPLSKLLTAAQPENPNGFFSTALESPLTEPMTAGAREMWDRLLRLPFPSPSWSAGFSTANSILNAMLEHNRESHARAETDKVKQKSPIDEDKLEATFRAQYEEWKIYSDKLNREREEELAALVALSPSKQEDERAPKKGKKKGKDRNTYAVTQSLVEAPTRGKYKHPKERICTDDQECDHHNGFCKRVMDYNERKPKEVDRVPDFDPRGPGPWAARDDWIDLHNESSDDEIDPLAGVYSNDHEEIDPLKVDINEVIRRNFNEKARFEQ